MADTTFQIGNQSMCRYFLQGWCRYGELCRYSHDCSHLNNTIQKSLDEQPTNADSTLPSTSKNWINAPAFVPISKLQNVQNTECAAMNKSWAQVASGSSQGTGTSISIDLLNEICPFEGPCPYGVYCSYGLHLELCSMCNEYRLHPKDENLRKEHNRECVERHQIDMEHSFAVARSQDKTCGICFDKIVDKDGSEKRFGILPNCNHIFCLLCIRKWRQSKQFERKTTRSCPECRISSDYVCPSEVWVETKEEKDTLLNEYRSALNSKDCKYFKKGAGKCPFGNKCFYKHALSNGDLVDVGVPKPARKVRRNTNEIIDLLDMYLWEFVDERDNHWLDDLDSDSDDSDF